MTFAGYDSTFPHSGSGHSGGSHSSGSHAGGTHTGFGGTPSTFTSSPGFPGSSYLSNAINSSPFSDHKINKFLYVQLQTVEAPVLELHLLLGIKVGKQYQDNLHLVLDKVVALVTLDHLAVLDNVRTIIVLFSIIHLFIF